MASVNTGTSSTVPLNSSYKSAVPANNCASDLLVLPSHTKTLTICTGLAVVFVVFPPKTRACSPTFEPVGSVAPVAAIVNSPLPSDLIVAPPRSIVSAAKYAVCHLLDALPNWKTPSWLGIRLPATCIPVLESSVDKVVPATLIPSMTTFPLLEFNVRSALDGAKIDDPTIERSPNETVANDSVPDPSVCKTYFAEPSAVGKVIEVVPNPIASIRTVPSKNASLNSKLDVPRSI